MRKGIKSLYKKQINENNAKLFINLHLFYLIF